MTKETWAVGQLLRQRIIRGTVQVRNSMVDCQQQLLPAASGSDGGFFSPARVAKPEKTACTTDDQFEEEAGEEAGATSEITSCQKKLTEEQYKLSNQQHPATRWPGHGSDCFKNLWCQGRNSSISTTIKST
eukprot:scpid90447/ scgid25507/ 